MNFQAEEITAYLATFVWPFMRISAMFVSIPVFSARNMPARLKVMLSALITFVVIPTLPSMPAVELLSSQGLMVCLQQLLLGVSSGFILQMVFSIMLFAGQGIAYSMGLGFASMVDPATGVQTPVIAQLFVIMSSLLFLTVDGHLLLIEMLAQSFITLPIAPGPLDLDGLWRLIMWSSQIFTGGVLLSLPIMATLLFVNISFGIASKAAPQLQLFGVGFPMTIMLGMLLVWIGLASLVEGFTDALHDGFMLVGQILRTN